jgi:hypothetical protein
MRWLGAILAATLTSTCARIAAAWAPLINRLKIVLE